MAFSMYKELLSPTGAEHAVWARLLPAQYPAQLVVARGTVLDVYAVREVKNVGTKSTAQLHVVGNFQFAGDIRGVQVLSLAGRGAALAASLTSIDVLVLSFSDATVSVVGLEPFTMKLQTLGMLNFEERGVGPGCTVQAKQLARHATGVAKTGAVAVDPDSRAFVFMPYDNQLAVVPVRRSVEGLDEPDDRDIEEDAAVAAAERDEAAAAAVAQDRFTRTLLHKPYVIDLKTIGMGMGGPGLGGVVSDVAFLHGYSVQPTLGLLVQTAMTSASRLSSLQHTTSVAAVSLDTTGASTPVVWQRDGLPHDAYCMVALPSPVGGVVVVSPNAIFHAEPYRTAGLALNGHAAYTVDVRGRYRLDTNTTHDAEAPRICLSLDAVRTCVLSPDRVLLTEATGALHLLAIHTVGRGEVTHMTLHPTMIRGPPATGMAWLPGKGDAVGALLRGFGAQPGTYAAGLLFLPSREADSVLAVVAGRLSGAGGMSTTTASAAGAARTGEGVEDDDSALYGAARAGGPAAVSATTDAPGKKRARAVSEDDGEAPPGMNDEEDEELPPGAADEEMIPGMEGGSSGRGGRAKRHAPDAHHGAVTEEDEDAFLYGSEARGAPGGGMDVEGGGGGSDGALPLLYLHPVDCLPSLGPVSDATMARSARLPGEDDEEPPLAPPPTELVAATGRNECGGISILHRALRPVVASQLRIPACTALFSLPFAAKLQQQQQQQEAGEGAAQGEVDAQAEADGGSGPGGLVLLSTETATRVLHVTDGLAELPPDATELVTGAQTLAAAALLQPGAVIDEDSTATGAGSSSATAVRAPHAFHVHDGSRAVLVQVHPGGVRITHAQPGTQVIQELALNLPADVGGLGAPEGVVITSVSSADPYVLVRLSDGSLRLLTAQEADGEMLVDDVRLTGHADDYVTAASLYRDETGALSACLGGVDAEARRAFALVARRSGTLDILMLPSLVNVFSAPAVHIAAHLLTNALATAGHAGHVEVDPAAAVAMDEVSEPCEDGGMEGAGSAASSAPARPRTFVKDVAGVRVGDRFGLVTVTSRDDVLCYLLHPGVRIGAEEEGRREMMGPGEPHPGGMRPSGNVRTSSIPKRGELRAAAEAARFDAEMARFQDVGHPLQAHRAMLPRFVRLPHVPGVVTRLASADAPPPDPAVAESALRLPSRSLLQPFADVSGWQGVAALTPSPLLLVALRGTLVALPLGVPDVSGGGGPGALPGEHLAWGTHGRGAASLVTAFTAFHAPFCPGGFIYAHSGVVQFATLPRPQWSVGHASEATGVPRPVPAWLVTGGEGGHAPPLAAADAVLALCGALPPTPASSTIPLCEPEEAAPWWPAVHADALHAPPLAVQALVVPGPAVLPFYRVHQGGRSILRLAYLEATSAALGAQALLDWYRKQKHVAAGARRPPPLPPTAAQLSCCVQPLFVAGMHVRLQREYEEEFYRYEAMQESTGGELEQFSLGQHIEYAPVPLPPSHQPHPRKRDEELPPAISPDPVAAVFNEVGLGRPPVFGTAHSVVLMWGSAAEGGRGWDVADSYDLEADEHITCMKEIQLADETRGRGEPAVVVGTNYLLVKGEDARPKGRLLVFRIGSARVAAGGEDPSATVSVPRLKLIHEQDIKAVPSVLVGVSARGGGATMTGARHVLVGVGSRLQVYEWLVSGGTPKLRMCAFVDFRTWVTAMEVVRDFVVVTDARGGLFFYLWREEDRQLLPLASAPDLPALVSASAIVNGDKLGIVSGDRYGNLAVHAYIPGESFTRLKSTGDFRVGHTGAGERMVRTRLSFPFGTPAADRRKHGVLVPSHAGGLSLLLPLDELTFKRLAMLQRVLTYCVPHAGGLNPRLHRIPHSPDAPGRAVNPARAVLDGPLLHRVLDLSTPSASALSASVGTTLDRVLANLRDADLSATAF